MIVATEPFLVSADLSKQLPPQRAATLRRAAGLTQAQVAERLGITEGRYGHYERGFRRFPVSIIPELAKALECSEGDLLGFEQPRSKRGPPSSWERRINTIQQLSKEKQREIQNVVDALIEQNQ